MAVWHATKADPHTTTTRDGHIVTFGLHEWARSDNGPLSYRSTIAVQFPEDGRVVEYCMLGSFTPGEAIAAARWFETTGCQTGRIR